MSAREWKPGDVALWVADYMKPERVFREGYNNGRAEAGRWFSAENGECWPDEIGGDTLRPLVVIDPEDREQVERLADLMSWALHSEDTPRLQAALREFANPKPLEEPTDPKARVEDRRENIWRLLADGDWVCTSGPDVGEYLSWAGLLERGPLEVSA